MLYKRMPIEEESPEERGYATIQYNLSESSVTDMKLGDIGLQLDNIPLEYIPHRGKAELRKLIANDGASLQEENVLLTNGAAGALFIINTALLSVNDHLIVVQPNYATNIAVPRTIGCSISLIHLQFENKWRLNIDDIKNAVQSNTRLISITTPHNPTGMLMTEDELNELIAFAKEKNIFLLADETYRNTCFATPYPLAASKSKKVITVSSLSKAYGLPGLRMGWIISQDENLMEEFLAAKEMIYISNSALDEEAAYKFYLQKNKWAEIINSKAMKNFELLKNWLAEEHRLECILPQGGVVCFPRIKNEFAVDTEKFYSILVNKYKTMAGAGHWFEMPDTYMRIGFGWTDEATLHQGLQNISKALSESAV